MARRRMVEITIAHDKILNSLPIFQQLLYLKILPHTDDFGRFEGDAEIVKARVDPLSRRRAAQYESAIVAIARAGLWSRYKTDKGRVVIQFNPSSFERINAFLIKNRTGSEYPAFKEGYELITNDMNSYHIVSKEKEVISKKQEERIRIVGEVGLEWPERLKALDGFMRGWSEWVEYRREIKKPLTSRSARAQLRFLEKQDQPVAVIEQSIRNQWQGLFELKANGGNRGRIVKAGGATTREDFERRVALDRERRSEQEKG